MGMCIANGAHVIRMSYSYGMYTIRIYVATRARMSHSYGMYMFGTYAVVCVERIVIIRLSYVLRGMSHSYCDHVYGLCVRMYEL